MFAMNIEEIMSLVMVCDNHDAKGNHEKTDDHHV